MFSTSLNEKTTHFPESIVDLICRLAKDENTDELNALIKSDIISIGIHEGKDNAIKRLAKDGDHRTVNYLINYFGASLEDALEGYARGNHDTKVKELLLAEVQPKFAIRGYAEAGKEDRVEELRQEALDIDRKTLDINTKAALVGFIMGGHDHKEKVIKKLISESQDENAMHEHIIKAYAIIGNIKKIEELTIEKNASNVWINNIIGSAFGGYTDHIDQLLEKVKEGFDTIQNAHRCTALGAAEGGQVKLVNSLGYCKEVVEGYISGRHVSQLGAYVSKFEYCI